MALAHSTCSSDLPTSDSGKNTSGSVSWHAAADRQSSPRARPVTRSGLTSPPIRTASTISSRPDGWPASSSDVPRGTAGSAAVPAG